MKFRLILAVMALAGMVGASTMLALPSTAASKDDFFKGCTSGVDCSGAQTTTTLDTSVWNLVRTALMVLGGLAVIMIIVGGFMYTASAGDPGRIGTAKKTIMYSIIGLVVAMLATAIITIVLEYFG